MKKIALIATLMSLSVFAHANKPGDGWDGTNASCTNVGTMIFKGKTGMVNHVLAMTTNGMSGSVVAFGLTSGFLECNTSKPVASIRPFVDKNMDALAADMSRGQGESLTALATLLNVDTADQAHFNAKLQSEFATVFSSEAVTSGQVIAGIMQTLATDAKLANYVG